MTERTKLPPEFIGVPVLLFLPIPIPGPGGGLGFPSIECTILEDHGSFLRVQEKTSSLPSIYPWERVQKIDRHSDITMAKGPLLINRN